MDKRTIHLPRAVLESLLPHGAALQLFGWILSHAEGEARQGHARGRCIDLAPGEVVLSLRKTARELGLSLKALRCALELLERRALVTCRGAQSRAHLGAQNGSVVSLANPCAYLRFYESEGHIMGHMMGHKTENDRAHNRAQNASENVPVIEPPYMQNGEAMGHIMGHNAAQEEPESSRKARLRKAASLLNNININTTTSSLNTSVISKEKHLKNNCSFSEGEAEKPADPSVLKGRKHSISGKRARAFEAFWDAFDHKVNRAQAIDAWAQIPTLNNRLMEKILAAARHYAQVERPAILARGGTPKWAQGWINDRRWEDECQVLPEEDYSFLERFGGSA